MEQIELLRFLRSYLKNRKQRAKVNISYSLFSGIISDVPQGSISVPLSLNIYICDMFYESRDLNTASYADGNTPSRCSQEFNNILKALEYETNI